MKYQWSVNRLRPLLLTFLCFIPLIEHSLCLSYYSYCSHLVFLLSELTQLTLIFIAHIHIKHMVYSMTRRSQALNGKILGLRLCFCTYNLRWTLPIYFLETIFFTLAETLLQLVIQLNLNQWNMYCKMFATSRHDIQSSMFQSLYAVSSILMLVEGWPWKSNVDYCGTRR